MAPRKKVTYSKKDRRPLPAPPASSQHSSQSQALPVNPRIPHDDPKIQAIAAGKSGLTVAQWQDVVNASKDEYNKPIDRDEERELADLFNIPDSDLDIDVSDDDRVANPSKAPQLPNLTRDNLISVKKEWAATYSNGLIPLAEAVMKEEIDARLKGKKALNDSDLHWTAKVMYDILLSTDRILLESVMLGNLSRDKRSNPKLKGILAHIQKQSANQPSIYHQMLVNKDGESPTTNDLTTALDILMGYLRGCDEPETQCITEPQISDQECHTIDTFKGFRKNPLPISRVAGGYRKYMSTTTRVKQTTAAQSKGKGKAAATAKGKGKGKASTSNAPPSSSSSSYHSSSDDSTTKKKNQKKGTNATRAPIMQSEAYSASHANQTLVFVEALRKRLSHVPANDRDKPLVFPLCEVGYSNRSIKRLKSHKAHASSNYIMNLLEAIFGSFQSKFSDAFEIEQEVIYLIWKVDQAEVSEIGWTKLAEGYIHNAGGFSHYPAGLSNESAQKTAHREWNEALDYLIKESIYCKNLESVVSQLQAEAEVRHRGQTRQDREAGDEARSDQEDPLQDRRATRGDPADCRRFP